jgi:hypothetical protein
MQLLSGLTSKGKKRDKVEVWASYAEAEQHQDISIKIPTHNISTQLGTTWYPRAPSPHPISI